MRLPAFLVRLLTPLAPWLLPIAAVGSMVELVGGGWDIQWHLARVPEVFWTPPHVVLYSGAGVVLASTGGAFLLRWGGGPVPRSLRIGTTFAFAGSLLQFVAGGFDNAWHAAFGADDALSPPHVLLTSAMVLATVGTTVALHAQRRGEESAGVRRRVSWLAHSVSVTSVYWAAWGLFFILLFPGFNANGRLVEAFGLRLFTGATFGALIAFTALLAVRVVRHPGAATVTFALSAGATLFVGALMGVVGPAELVFFPVLAAPGVVADLVYRPGGRRAEYVVLVLGGLLAQFAFTTGGVIEEMTRPADVPGAFALAYLAGGVVAAILASVLARSAEGLAASDATAVPAPA